MLAQAFWGGASHSHHRNDCFGGVQGPASAGPASASSFSQLFIQRGGVSTAGETMTAALR